MAQILNIPAQVICSCNTSGVFTPIRFRYETPSCELITVDVLSVDSRSESGSFTSYEMRYVCRGMVQGRMHTFYLRYYIPDHRWTITGIYG